MCEEKKKQKTRFSENALDNGEFFVIQPLKETFWKKRHYATDYVGRLGKMRTLASNIIFDQNENVLEEHFNEVFIESYMSSCAWIIPDESLEKKT